MIAREAEGFLYLVSSLGVTGTRSEIRTDLTSIVEGVRQVAALPDPVGEETRRVLAILALSPISMLSSGFTAQLGGPVGTSAAINSIYAVFSVAAMSVLVVLFGIS